MQLKSLTKTCDACPAQWEGETVDGGIFYARYRWGYLYVTVDGENVFELDYGGGYDGSMTTDEMLRLTGIEVVA
jgi:hypothetical protein